MKQNAKILKIPLPGGSRKARTGAVQFQGDWPGLFVRGEDAICLRNAIRQVEELLDRGTYLLTARAILDLVHFAEIIEREVFPKGPMIDSKRSKQR